MRWILGSIASLIILAALAALVAPRLIEWNAYRPRIAEALAQRTGLQADIAGDLHLVLLPTPTLFASGVRLAPPGRSDQPLAEVEGLRAELAPLALLLGEVEPRVIALDAPDLTLRLQGEGPAEAATLARRLLSTGMPGQAPGLRGLSIRNGRLKVLRGTARVAALAGIQVDFAAPDSEQPGHMQVDARWNEVPVTLAVDIGALPPSGATTLRARLDLAGGLAQAGYGGTLSLGADGSDGAAGPGVATEGQFSATVRDPAALLTLLGLPGESAEGLPRDEMTLAARMIAEPGTLVVNDLDLRWGRATAGGAAAAILGPPLDLNLTLHVAGLELDGLAGLLPQLVPDRSAGLVLPEVGRITFDVTATALRAHGSVVRRVQMAGVLDQGSLELQDLHAELPGSASVNLQGRLVAPGTLPEFTGKLSLEAADARRTLLWLGLGDGDLPPTAPRRVRAEASLALDAGLWRIVDLEAEVDGATLHGGIAIRPSGRPSFSANLRLAEMSLDPWMPTLSAVLDRQLAGASLPAGTARSVGDWLADLGGLLTSADSNLRLGLHNISWDKRVLTDANVDLALVQGMLSLNRATLVLADGLEAELTGTASTDEDSGRLDYDLGLMAEGRHLLDRLQQLAPVLLPGGRGAAGGRADAGATQPGLIPPPAVAPPSGPSRLSLRLSGDTGQALVRELELAMPGAELKARGTLGLAAPVPTLVADLSWKVPDPARLRDHLSFIVGLPESGLSRRPSEGSAALAVDAGTVTVSALTLSLPGLAVTGEGRVSRTARPLAFDLALAAQASSLQTMLRMIAPGRRDPAQTAAPVAEDVPVALVLRAAGTPAAVTLQEARLAYGRTELRLDGGGRLRPAPALEGELHLTAPDLAELMTNARMPPPGGAPLGPIDLLGRYAVDGNVLRVEGVTGMAGPARLSAAVELGWGGERPMLRADLGLAGLPLDRLLPDDIEKFGSAILAEAGDTALSPRLVDGVAEVLPAVPPTVFGDMAYDISMGAEGIAAAGGLIADGRFEAQLRDRDLTVPVIEARLAGGRLAGAATLDLRGLPALSVTADLQGIDMPTLMADAEGLDGLSGRADAVLRLRTAGRTPDAMLERLSGQAEIAVPAGSFAGLDLAALAAEAQRDPPVAVPADILRAALLADDGMTAFRNLAGLLFLESGVLRLQQVEADLAIGSAAWHGSVSLPARELDLTGTFRLDALPEAPAVEVEIDGPFGALQRHALIDAMAQYLAGRATAARLTLPPPEAPPEAPPGDASTATDGEGASDQGAPGAVAPDAAGPDPAKPGPAAQDAPE